MGPRRLWRRAHEHPEAAPLDHPGRTLAPYFTGKLELFRSEAARALELNSKDGTTLGLIGMYTAWSGNWEAGLDMLEKARQLNPGYPGYYHSVMGTAAYFNGDYEQTVQEFSKANLPEWPLTQIFLTAAYSALGQAALVAEHAGRLHALLEETDIETARHFLERCFPFLPDFIDTIMNDILAAERYEAGR